MKKTKHWSLRASNYPHVTLLRYFNTSVHTLSGTKPASLESLFFERSFLVDTWRLEQRNWQRKSWGPKRSHFSLRHYLVKKVRLRSTPHSTVVLCNSMLLPLPKTLLALVLSRSLFECWVWAPSSAIANPERLNPWEFDLQDHSLTFSNWSDPMDQFLSASTNPTWENTAACWTADFSLHQQSLCKESTLQKFPAELSSPRNKTLDVMQIPCVHLVSGYSCHNRSLVPNPQNNVISKMDFSKQNQNIKLSHSAFPYKNRAPNPITSQAPRLLVPRPSLDAPGCHRPGGNSSGPPRRRSVERASPPRSPFRSLEVGLVSFLVMVSDF